MTATPTKVWSWIVDKFLAHSILAESASEFMVEWDGQYDLTWKPVPIWWRSSYTLYFRKTKAIAHPSHTKI